MLGSGRVLVLARLPQVVCRWANRQRRWMIFVQSGTESVAGFEAREDADGWNGWLNGFPMAGMLSRWLDQEQRSAPRQRRSKDRSRESRCGSSDFHTAVADQVTVHHDTMAIYRR